MKANITRPSTPFEAQVTANLRYFIELCDQLDDTRLETAETEKQNIWQAITFGLRFDGTADLSAQLMTKLLPLIERKGYAADWIEPVESAATKVQSPRLTLELTHLLGILHRLVGLFGKSIRLHQQVLAQTGVEENRALHILSHQQMCNVYLAQRNYPEAKQYGEDALALLDQYHAPRVNRAWILNSLGLIAHEMGHYDAAATWFEQTIAVQKEKNNDVLLAINWMNYGRTLSQLTRYDDAADAYDQSLDLLDGTTTELDRCQTQINYGDMLSQSGQYDRAEKLFRAIDLDYLRKTHHYRLQMLVVHNLAYVLLAQNKLEQASFFLDETYTIAETHGYTMAMGSVLKMKGEISCKNGDLSQAKLLWEQAKSIFVTLSASWAKQEQMQLDEWLSKFEDVKP